MSKFMFPTLATLSLCALMTTGSAWAQNRGHARGNMSNHTWRADRDGDRDTWNRDWRGDRDTWTRDWRGDRDRWTFGNDQHPLGWSKGKKTGWGNCDVPPGQAKKMGCNAGWYSRRNDRSRDRYRRYR